MEKRRGSSKNYRSCLVPSCSNNSKTTPNKIFFTLPRNGATKKAWLEAVNKDVKDLTSRTVYCCEDHFDLEKDAENQGLDTKHCEMGLPVRLKSSVVPHKGIFGSGADMRNANSESDWAGGGMNGEAAMTVKDEITVKYEPLMPEVATSSEMDDPPADTSPVTPIIVKCEADEDPDEQSALPPSSVEQDPLLHNESTVMPYWTRTPDRPPNGMLGMFACEAGRSILGDCDEGTAEPRTDEWDVASPQEGNNHVLMQTPDEGCRMFVSESAGVNANALIRVSGQPEQVFTYESGNSDASVVMVVEDQSHNGQEMYVYQPLNADDSAATPAETLVYETHDVSAVEGYTSKYWSSETGSSMVYGTVKTEDDMGTVDNSEEGADTFVYETETVDDRLTGVDHSVQLSETSVYETESAGEDFVGTDPLGMVAESQQCEVNTGDSFMAVDEMGTPAEMFVYETHAEGSFVVDSEAETPPETFVYETNCNGSILETTDLVDPSAKTFVYASSDVNNGFVGVEIGETFVYETNGDGDGLVTVNQCNEITETLLQEHNGDFVASSAEVGAFIYETDNSSAGFVAVHQIENSGEALVYETNSDEDLTAVEQSENLVNASAGSNVADVDSSEREPNTFVIERENGKDRFVGVDDCDKTIDSLSEDASMTGLGVEDESTSDSKDDAYPVALWTFSSRDEFGRLPNFGVKKARKSTAKITVKTEEDDYQWAQRFNNTRQLMERERAFMAIQKEATSLHKASSGPATCNVCGRKLRRKQCLHVV